MSSSATTGTPPLHRRVVVPIDLDHEASFDAALFVLEWMRGSELYLVQVVDNVEKASPGVLLGETTPESRLSHTRTVLDQKLEELGLRPSGVDVRLGSAGREIVLYAEEVGAELIAMPSHGRRGIARLILGSVAEVVVRAATCPVAVLRLRAD